jgi:TRAP-type C4-dicarboxylate transport system substrate-binding protein
MGTSMLKMLARCALFSFALVSAVSAAEPIKLKLAFFSSDRTLLYQGGVKPFVDAVNSEGKGVIEIEVFFGGALGKVPAQQVQLVREGLADIAYIIPGYSAEQFPDNAVIELPGLFRNQQEASLAYTRMIAVGALRGYEEFIVITAFAAEPHSIHVRRTIASLDDFKGLKIRANNPTEAATFEKLGMGAIVMPANQISDAIGSGTIDGAAIPPAMLTEFGVGRLATYHYMIHADAPSLALVMSRKKFESLPARGQEIIRKYSGDWSVAQSNAFFEDINAKAMQQLMSDSKRHVIFPSEGDRPRIEAAFKGVIDDWVAKSPRNGELLGMVRAEIAKMRLAQ